MNFRLPPNPSIVSRRKGCALQISHNLFLEIIIQFGHLVVCRLWFKLQKNTNKMRKMRFAMALNKT